MFLPAMRLDGGEVLTGWYVLGEGWRASTAGIWAWYANPLLVGAVGLMLLRWSRVAGVVAGTALVLGLTSFATPDLVARAGFPSPSLSFAAGFYLWLASLLSLTVCAWVAAFPREKHA